MKNDSKKTPSIPATETETKREPIKSLDQLIEVLDQDALRNIVGGAAARPKGGHAGHA